MNLLEEARQFLGVLEEINSTLRILPFKAEKQVETLLETIEEWKE